MSNSKTILGIVVAGAVGVAIGKLMAPQKGSDLKKSIKDSIDEFGDQVGDFISEGKEKLMGAKEEAKKGVNDVKKDVKTGFDNTKASFS